MSVIRKKPYVEKVVESLSSESLELLRETLNTNKDNVNVSLIGGNNLLKKFEKEYIGTAPSTEKYSNGITLYFNIESYKTYDDFLAFFNKVGTSISTQGMILKLLTDDTETMADDSISLLKPQNENIKAILVDAGYGNIFGFVNDEASFNASLTYLKTQPRLSAITGTWNGIGWYKIDNYTTNPTIVKFDSNISQSYTIIQFAVDGLGEFISDTPFKTNTQLIGHIPQVGDTIEKVYFNPNAYSTDEEWKLWYESMVDYQVPGGGVDHDNKELGRVTNAGSTEPLGILLNAYEFGGVVLTDILAFSILLVDTTNANLFYITNDALTGSQSAIYQQFGITESGWYIVGGTTQAPTLTKANDIVTAVVSNTSHSVTEINETNAKHFAKALSINETFTETPVQNLLKPNPIQVGQEVSKIYINLGYFDNDLNKFRELEEYNEGDQWYSKLLFKYNGNTSCALINSYISLNGILPTIIYVTQQEAINNNLSQEYVNKWCKVEYGETVATATYTILENQKIYELDFEEPITITQVEDNIDFLSFNKPFTEISGYIYDEVTPVNLQLENNNLKTGILVWNDEYCTLLAYHRFEDMREYEIDYEKYSFKAINESLTINELRRVVFTPTQESTVEEASGEIGLMVKIVDLEGACETYALLTKASLDLLMEQAGSGEKYSYEALIETYSNMSAAQQKILGGLLFQYAEIVRHMSGNDPSNWDTVVTCVAGEGGEGAILYCYILNDNVSGAEYYFQRLIVPYANDSYHIEFEKWTTL